MRNKKILCMFIFVFMIVLSIGAVSAQDADDAIASDDDGDILSDSEPTSSGTVSGGVDVKAESPWTSKGGDPAHGELSYDIPSDAKTIKSADVYVNVYGASTADTYSTNVTTTIQKDNGNKTYNEVLCAASDKSSKVYPVNDHVTKSYLDYMIHYNITDQLTGLNGTNLKISVDTSNVTGKQFDGRIKLIALVLAYDDGDSDLINYWINDNQIWTDTNATLTFDTTSLTSVYDMSLTNIALSSADATYWIDDKLLEVQDHKSGSYYQYNKWDVTTFFNNTGKTELFLVGSPGIYGGVSHKNALTVLTAIPGSVQTSVSVKVRDYSKNIVYPGYTNALTVTVNTNKAGKYVIELYDGTNLVNTTEVDLNTGESTVDVIDPTIRSVSASSEYIGASGTYETANYTVKLLVTGNVIDESSCIAKVLYNGYLGKDTYNQAYLEPFYQGTISGDIVILTNGSYTGGTVNNRVCNFNVELDGNSNIVKAFLYVPYCYASNGKDNINMYNVTLNGNKLTPVYFARDQSNLEYNSGYGTVVYDVTEAILTGSNVLDINKTFSAIYPSTLVYMYNTTGSKFVKDIYISNGADLIGTYGGTANAMKIDSVINVDASDVLNATAYIFATGAADGRGTVVINGVAEAHPWNGGSQSSDLYTKDITGIVKNSNSISVIYSGTSSGSFTALQQIIVLTKVKEEPKPEPKPQPAPVYKMSKNTNINMLYTSKKQYKVLITKDGKALSGAKVTIKFNGKKKVVTTNKKGYAIFKIPNVKPKKGKYTITATFNGKTVKNTVKVNSILKVSNKKVKKSAKVTKIKVSLKKVNGKFLKGKLLKLKFKGKTFKAKTSKKGVATFKIKKNVFKKLKVGKKYAYKVTYLKDTVSKKITIKK